MGPGHGGVVLEEFLIGMGEPVGERRRLGRIEPAESERAQFPRHRVVAHRSGPSGEGGLHRGIAEPLPGGRERHDVGGGVEIAEGGGRVAADDHAAGGGLGEMTVEDLAVSLLRRSGEPVGGAERPREFEGLRHTLALDCPHRMHDHELIGTEAETCPFRCSIPVQSTRIEPVADGDRPDPALGEFGPGEVVDRDMAPGGVVDGQLLETRIAVALPGGVMVMPDRGAAGPGAGHGPGCR